MKHNILKGIVATAIATASLTACDSQLDIIPKGQSTLSTVTDLEMLLNANYDMGLPYTDLGIICNESLGMGDNVPTQLKMKNTLTYAMLAYDESVDRANLTLQDERYEHGYKYINNMNTIIAKMPGASGDEGKKKVLIAEAHVMRGYLHWLLVNIYAKQYDEATAAKEGGIPYVTDIDVTTLKEKLSLAQVYENILNDCSDENINALPVRNDDVLRADQAWGNAVRAKVLMQMKRYKDAIPYAEKALKINGNIDDRSTVVELKDWYLQKQSPCNYIYFGTSAAPFAETISMETAMLFEEGDYVKDYAFAFGMDPGEGGGGDDDDDDDWGDDDDDDWGDDEEWLSPTRCRKMYASLKKRAAAMKITAKRAADDEEDWGDDDDWGDEDIYTAPNIANPAWSPLFGMMLSGVMGSAMYYGANAYANTFGITSDRMHYTLAECYIRTERIADGMALVNKVRQYRIHPDKYTELSADNEAEAMALMQNAKWIECLSTYENFFDCKRWNTEPDYQRTITRTIMDMDGNMDMFSIAPDSKLWVFPFPMSATRKNPTLTQNY